MLRFLAGWSLLLFVLIFSARLLATGSPALADNTPPPPCSNEISDTVLKELCQSCMDSGKIHVWPIPPDLASRVLSARPRSVEDNAGPYLASFTGPISARMVEPGEQFFRYTSTANGTGYSLTKTRFASPTKARVALDLIPHNNSARFRQVVTAVRCTLVLEGDIFEGMPGEMQTLALDTSAFEFSVSTSQL